MPWVAATYQSHLEGRHKYPNHHFSFAVGSIYLHKMAFYPHWPVKVTSNENGRLGIEYFGTGETSVINTKDRSAFFPFGLDKKRNKNYVKGLAEAGKFLD